MGILELPADFNRRLLFYATTCDILETL